MIKSETTNKNIQITTKTHSCQNSKQNPTNLISDLPKTTPSDSVSNHPQTKTHDLKNPKKSPPSQAPATPNATPQPATHHAAQPRMSQALESPISDHFDNMNDCFMSVLAFAAIKDLPVSETVSQTKGMHYVNIDFGDLSCRGSAVGTANVGASDPG